MDNFGDDYNKTIRSGNLNNKSEIKMSKFPLSPMLSEQLLSLANSCVMDAGIWTQLHKCCSFYLLQLQLALSLSRAPHYTHIYLYGL